MLVAEVEAQDFTYTNVNDAISITGYIGPGGNVTIPSTIAGLPVTSIGANAFLNLTNLTSVTIPDTVTSIGPDAFANCANLASVTIGNSVTNIGASALAYCPSLASVYFEGDAPTAVANVLFQSPATVHYADGTAGFGPIFAGRPTALWVLPYALGTSTVLVGPGSGSNSVTLAVSPETGVWTAATSVPWLHLADSFQGGTGSTNVVFSFDANPGDTRSATLTIAGITLTVIQAGANYVFANPVRLFSASGWDMHGIAVNNAGSVYMTITNLGNLVKWTASGNTVTTLLDGDRPPPMDVAVDWGTNVYVSDDISIDDVLFLWPSGVYNYSVRLSVPVGPFALDAAGNLYTAQSGEIDEWTVISNQFVNPVNKWVNPGIASPGAIAVDSFGKNVYFTSGNSLQKLTAANNSVSEVANPGSFPGVDAATLGALAVDRGGNLYLSAYNSLFGPWVIMRWNAASNSLSVLASSSSGQFNSAQLFGVAVDKVGNVYFTDDSGGVLYEQLNAFVDVGPKSEGQAAGQDSLAPVLPSTVNLLAPLAPVSDSSWLTIVGVTNGVVSYSFAENLGYTRKGHITVLGNTVEITQNGPLFTLGATNVCEGPSAGSDSVVLGVVPNIASWTATNNAPWLHLSATNQSGTGTTNVVFSFDANPGRTRSGTLTIAHITLTVTQVGATYVKTGSVTALVSSGLSGPSGLAVDGTGNVYFADTYRNAIKEWIAADTVITLVSSGLNRPQGVAVDGAGNVYIADTENNAVKEWTVANSMLTTLVPSGLNRPEGVTVDSQGNVYIADTFDSAVKEWLAASNEVVTLVSSSLVFPAGVAVDQAGNVYIADSGNNVIKKWTPANSTVTTLVSSGLGSVSAVAVDGAGNIYIADTNHLVIEKWTAASNILTSFVSSGTNGPTGVAVGSTGNLYFTVGADGLLAELPYAFVDTTPRLESADEGTDALPVVLPVTVDLLAPFNPTSDQPWLTITGSTNDVVSFSFSANSEASRTAHINLLGQGIPVTQGGLTYSLGTTALLEGPTVGTDSVALVAAPSTAAWAATNNASWLRLSAANQSGTGSTNVVFSFDANPGPTRYGTLTIAGQTVAVTQAGSTYIAARPLTTLVSTGLNEPSGIAVDGGGNVYIADTINHAIKEWIMANNTVIRLVSSGLDYPVIVRLDSAGNVYFADYGLNTIDEWISGNSNLTTLVSSGLSEPDAVAVDAAGNVYIADLGNNAIKKWSAAKDTLVTLLSSGLNQPDGLAVDPAGNIFISDYGNNAIKELAPTSAVAITLATPGLVGPSGVSLDGSGNVYIAAYGQNAIKEWNAANNTLVPVVSTGLFQPQDVAVDAAKNVYIADYGHNAIKEVPYSFVDASPRWEDSAAGQDSLPVVLPFTQNLQPPFAPTSDQAWLTITSVSNGEVSFSFTANLGPSRTAHISLLGQTITITQGLIGTTPYLTGVQKLGNGAIQFFFTNNPNASFTVLSTTNLLLPLSNWTVVGSATNVSSDLFQFTSQPTTNDQQRYYTVHSP